MPTLSTFSPGPGLFDALDTPCPPLRVMTIASGSSGNSTFVQAGSTALLVDIGVSLTALRRGLRTVGLRPMHLDAVVVTHAHGDHISGLAPLARLVPRLQIIASAPVLRRARRMVGTRIREVRLSPRESARIGGVAIHAIRTSHDAPGSLGLLLEAGGRRLAYLTDLGRACPGTRALVQAADAVVLETNHCPEMLANGPYPPALRQRVAGRRGHLSNPDAGELLAGSASPRLRRVICAHLSQENNTPELAERSVRDALNRASLQADVVVAPRRRPGELFEV